MEFKQEGQVTQVTRGNVTFLTVGEETETVPSYLQDVVEDFPFIPSTRTRSDAVGGLETGMAAL